MGASVIFRVINCDGNEVDYSYRDMGEFMEEWNKEDMPNIPMLDDQLVHAEVDGVVFAGETVLDVMNAITYVYNWHY